MVQQAYRHAYAPLCAERNPDASGPTTESTTPCCAGGRGAMPKATAQRFEQLAPLSIMLKSKRRPAGSPGAFARGRHAMLMAPNATLMPWAQCRRPRRNADGLNAEAKANR